MVSRSAWILGLFLMGSIFSACSQKSQTYTGTITDTMCGKDHSAMHITPEDKCVRECVQAGAKYALYDGRNIYTLSDQKNPERFAAQKVKISGVLNESAHTLTVEKIEPAQ
jgi:hypothetical protein